MTTNQNLETLTTKFPRTTRNVTLTAITLASALAFGGCAQRDDEERDDPQNPPQTTGMVYSQHHGVWITRPGYFGPSGFYEPSTRRVVPIVSTPAQAVKGSSVYIAPKAYTGGSSGFSAGSHPSGGSAPHATPSYGGFGGTGHGFGGHGG